MSPEERPNTNKLCSLFIVTTHIVSLTIAVHDWSSYLMLSCHLFMVSSQKKMGLAIALNAAGLVYRTSVTVKLPAYVFDISTYYILFVH